MRFRNKILLICLLFALFPVFQGLSEVAFPGNYAGIPIYDRWGGCYLYSGYCAAYVSEKVKQQLRPYEGKCVKVDVQKVYQPMNPGSCRFEKIGDVQLIQNKTKYDDNFDDLKLSSTASVEDNGNITIVMSMFNPTDKPILIYRGNIGFVLLKKSSNWRWKNAAPDGPSVIFTMTEFEVGGNEPRFSIKSQRFAWSLDNVSGLTHRFVLGANMKKSILVKFEKLPPGEYDFICGYGENFSGSNVASNLTAFDIDSKGKGKIIKRTGR